MGFCQKWVFVRNGFLLEMGFCQKWVLCLQNKIGVQSLQQQNHSLKRTKKKKESIVMCVKYMFDPLKRYEYINYYLQSVSSSQYIFCALLQFKSHENSKWVKLLLVLPTPPKENKKTWSCSLGCCIHHKTRRQIQCAHCKHSFFLIHRSSQKHSLTLMFDVVSNKRSIL